MSRHARTTLSSFSTAVAAKSMAVVLLALSTNGCVDLRTFNGEWEGNISVESAIRQGFAADAQITSLQLTDVTTAHVDATLSTSDGIFDGSVLETIEGVTSDVLANLTFDGNPLRSYMMFSELAEEPDGDQVSNGPAWIVLSLFDDSRVEMRIMRRNNIFGLFALHPKSE